MSVITNVISDDKNISDFTKINTYYIDNSKKKITITLNQPSIKANLNFYLIDQDGYECAISLQKGYFFIEPQKPELHLVYINKWVAIGENPVPFLDDEPNDVINFNLFNDSRTAENFLTVKGFTGTNNGVLSDINDPNSARKYKIDKDLILMSSPQFMNTEEDEQDGVGAIYIYKRPTNVSTSYEYHSLITRPFNIRATKNGAFSKHTCLVNMNTYDLLIVSAPDIKKIMVYSFRKNVSDEFYFYLEYVYEYNDTLPVQFLQPIDDFGFIYFTNRFNVYNVNTNANTQSSFSEIKSLFQNIVSHKKTLLISDASNQMHRYHIDPTSSPASFSEHKLITSDVSDGKFGSNIVIDSSSIVHFTSEKHLYTFNFGTDQYLFDLSFNDKILSMDKYAYTRIDASGNIVVDHLHLVLVDSNFINVYLLRNNSIIMSDFISENNFKPTKVKFDIDGETFLAAYPFANLADETLGNIENMGYLVRYDLFLDKTEIQSPTIPPFTIPNQLLIEYGNYNGSNGAYTKISNILETTFLDASSNSVNLISNRDKDSNVVKILEKVHLASPGTGESVISINSSKIQSLLPYPVFKIYTPNLNGAQFIKNGNKYLRVTAADKQAHFRSYLEPIQNKTVDNYESVIVKVNGTIQQFFLGMGANNEWNLTRLEFTDTQTYNPPNLLKKNSQIFGASLSIPFKFQSYVFSDEIIFTIQKPDEVVVLFYSLVSNTVTGSTIYPVAPNHYFYVDQFRNIIDYNGVLARIYPRSANYANAKNIKYETDLGENDQFFFAYFPQSSPPSLHVVHNKLNDEFSNTQYKIVNLTTGHVLSGNTSILNVSNISLGELVSVVDFKLLVNNNTATAKIFTANEQDVDNLLLNNDNLSSPEVWKLPTLGSTQFTSFKKLPSSQMIHCKTNVHMMHDTFEISDLEPKRFFHSFYSQFFNKQRDFDVINHTYFYDNRQIVELDDPDCVLIQRKENTLRKFVINASSGYKIKSFAYNQQKKLLAVIENKLTQLSQFSFRIFDVNEVQTLVYQKDISNVNVCFDTLTVHNDVFSFGENIDQVTQGNYRVYNFNHSSYPTVIQETSYSFDIVSPEVCIFASPNGSIFIENIYEPNGQTKTIRYYTRIDDEYSLDGFPLVNKELSQKFKVKFIDPYYIVIYDDTNSYLFSNDMQVYHGKRISKISENKTFEINQGYYVDLENNINTSKSNITLVSPLFYSFNDPNEFRFYILVDEDIYLIDSTYNYSSLDPIIVDFDGRKIQRILENGLQNVSNGVKGYEYYLSTNFNDQVGNNTTINWIMALSYYPLFFRQPNFQGNSLPDNARHVFLSFMQGVKFPNVNQNLLNKPASISRFDQGTEIVDITYQSNPVYNYQLGVYYVSSDLSTNLVNASNVVSWIDISGSQYVEYPVDSDETIRIRVDKGNKLIFGDYYYNEIKFAQEITKLNDFYAFNRKDGHIAIAQDGNQILYFDIKNKIVYLLIRDSKFSDNNIYIVERTYILSNDVLNFMSADTVFSSIKVDWKNQYIYMGLGGTDSNAKGRVLVCSFINRNLSEIILEEVLTSVFDPVNAKSFGTSIDVNSNGDIVAIGEPLAPAVGSFKKGIVHIYRRIESNLIWTNELRSEEAPVGFFVKLSNINPELGTFGYSENPLEKTKLVVFRSILLPAKRSIVLPYIVPDFEFLNGNVILTSNEITPDQKSVLHYIQKVNDCFEIITKRDITHDTIVNRLRDQFEICSLRNQFTIFIRHRRQEDLTYKEVSIELYKAEEDLKLYASIDLESSSTPLFSNVSCSYDSSMMGYQSYSAGKLNFILFF